MCCLKHPKLLQGLLITSVFSVLIGCRSTSSDLQEITAADDPGNSFKWVFTQKPDYSPISPAYKGPNLLLKDRVNRNLTTVDEEAIQSEVSANGKRIFFVSQDQLTADAPRFGYKIYYRDVPQDVGIPYGDIKLASIRPATVLTSACGNVSLGEKVANGNSYLPSVSRDGTKIAFISTASNLTPQIECDSATGTPKTVELLGNIPRVYLRDLQNDTIELVSGIDPTDLNGSLTDYMALGKASISLDGNVVAFVARNPVTANYIGLKKIDNHFSDVFVYNRITKKTAWVSYHKNLTGAFAIGVPHDERGNSSLPQLDEDGDTLVFRSCGKLVPEDNTDVGDLTDPENLKKECEGLVSDIYVAKFDKGPLGIDVDKRNLLQLVSVDKGSVMSTGSYGSWAPSVTADGRYVMFSSAKGSNMIADIRPNAPMVAPDTVVSPKVYLRDLITQKTSLISITQMETGAGLRSFSEMSANSSSDYPIISSDGKYALFTTKDRNVYMSTQMKDFRTARIVSGTNNSCNNLTIRSNDSKSRADLTEMTGTVIVKGGWQDAMATGCLPPLNPDTYGNEQVYVVALNGLQVTGINAVSVTPPLRITNWLSNYHTDPTVTLRDGKELLVSQFRQVWQVQYADDNAYSGSSNGVNRLISDGAKTVAFYSSANNLFGPIKTAEEEKPYITAMFDGKMYYKEVPDVDVGYYLDVEDEKSSYYPVNTLYTDADIQSWMTFLYTPANPIRKIEQGYPDD